MSSNAGDTPPEAPDTSTGATDWPSLNDAQRSAVRSSLDPQLVVAGPGTGKTRVLVCRAAHLIAERGFDPGEIVLVTFTRRAAAQLIERLAGIVGRDGRNVRAGTLHHFCYEILQDHADRADIPEDFVVVDETTTDPWWQGWYEQNKDWCNEHDLGSYRQVQTHVGRVKLGIDAVSGRLQEGMRAYQQMLRERNALDFSDLLVGARDLLQSEEARAAVTAETGAVLVDEFQDTDPVQYEILRRLGEDVHLFCVADGDQSVYRFRGARPENLQRYIDDFGCSKEEGSLQVLGTNYRTAAAIYEVAEGVLDGSARIKSRGDVRAQRREDGEVRLKGCGNPEKERQFVLETVREWIREEGVPRREIAVLTRWNSRARELEEAFLKDGIACRTSSSDDLMETPPARKLQALLRVVDARRRGQPVGPPLAELLGQMLPERTMTAIRDFGARAMPERTLWTVFQTIVSDARARRSAHLSDEKARLERVYATISNLLQQTKKDGLTIGEYVQTALEELEDPLQLLQREEPALEDPKEYPSIQAAGTALRKWKRAQGNAHGDPNGPRLLLHSRTPQITRLWRQLARRALGVETDPPAPLPEKQEALFGRPTDEGIPPLGADDLIVTSDLDGLFDWGERTGAFDNGDQSPQIIVLTSKDIRLGSGQLPMGIDSETVVVVRPGGTIKSPSVQLFKALQAATAPPDPSPVFPEYVMVDIEATSLDPKTCHVAEIGAVMVEGGTPTARFSELVQLPEDLPPEEKETLREVCGLDPERDFGDARPLEDVWTDFCDFVGERPLVAHNGQQYDFRVLQRLDRALDAGGRWTGTYDMLPAAYTLYPELERHTAEHLKQKVAGIESDTAHRALSDCMDQQSILTAMQRRRARRDRVTEHEPLLPLLLAALTYERPGRPEVSSDMAALIRVGLTWALRDASPASEDLEAVLPRALPDRFRKTDLYDSINETQLIDEATGIKPGLKRRLGALFEPYADRALRGEGLGNLLTHLTLWGENQEAPGKEVVSLSTYHSAKGLEFEKVVCMDAHNNAFPPFFARDPEERRESRRLLYVGMTRAENELVLTYPKVERGYERSPTPFLKPFTTDPDRAERGGHDDEAIPLTP